MNSKPKILIVDDEEGPRESLKIILKPEFDVVTLGRGSEAVEMLRDGGFDLILLDITMPEDLSGIDTLQAIRAAAIDVEAIVISGGLVNLGDVLVSRIRARFPEHLEGRAFRPEIPIVAATLGDQAGVIGAAVLARQVDPAS